MNLKSAQIHPQIAMAVIDLFPDAEKAYTESKDYYGENFWMDESEDSSNDLDTENTEEQTNEVQDIMENQIQNQ